MVSAFWHGFYAGYYITFISGGYFLYMSRLVSHIHSYIAVVNGRYLLRVSADINWCLVVSVSADIVTVL
jgi:MBOAT, membrane-bound O-acyltransferase family